MASGTVTLDRDTVDYNTARTSKGSNASGGGIYAAGGTISLLNTTVEFNTSMKDGPGIYIAGNAKVRLDHFTVAHVINNTAYYVGYPDIYGSYTIC